MKTFGIVILNTEELKDFNGGDCDWGWLDVVKAVCLCAPTVAIVVTCVMFCGCLLAAVSIM